MVEVRRRAERLSLETPAVAQGGDREVDVAPSHSATSASIPPVAGLRVGREGALSGRTPRRSPQWRGWSASGVLDKGVGSTEPMQKGRNICWTRGSVADHDS